VPLFLAEVYQPRVGAAQMNRSVGEELSTDGRLVQSLHAVFVPEDETWFYFFEAPSSAEVREAAGRAGLAVERIVEAVRD
jgi:hypothetical protein